MLLCYHEKCEGGPPVLHGLTANGFPLCPIMCAPAGHVCVCPRRAHERAPTPPCSVPRQLSVRRCGGNIPLHLRAPLCHQPCVAPCLQPTCRDKESARVVTQAELQTMIDTGSRDGVARVSAKRRLLGGNRYNGFETSMMQCFGMKVGLWGGGPRTVVTCNALTHPTHPMLVLSFAAHTSFAPHRCICARPFLHDRSCTTT